MTLPSDDPPEQELPPRPDVVPHTDTPAVPAAPADGPAPREGTPALPVGEDPAEPTGPAEPTRPVQPTGPVEPAGRLRPARGPRTRISAAWIGVWAGVVVVILLIIFIGQNTAKVRLNFLWMDGLIPVALALLIAGVAGAIVAMAVAAARIIQLRRLVRRRR